MIPRVDGIASSIVYRLANELKLRALSPSDRDEVTDALRQHPPLMSEYTFSNLAAWNSPQRYIGRFEGHLLVGHEDDGTLCLLEPIGPEPAKIIEALLNEAPLRFEPISKGTVAKVRNARITELRDHFDYVYHTRALVELGAKELKGHEKDIRRFENRNTARCVPLDTSMISACRSVLERWYAGKTPDEWMRKELIAANTALDRFDDWALQGIAVLIDSTVEAYTVGEALNADTFVIHYGKMSRPITGLTPYLLNRLAQLVEPRFTFINRMQDLGVPGLRSAKLSWHPSHMVEKFSVDRQT